MARQQHTANRSAGALIAERIPFRGHNLTGDAVDGPVSPGRLPAECVDSLREATTGGGYVVFSYATPIAWWSPGAGWTVPEVRYSVTTCRHQAIVRRALATAGDICGRSERPTPGPAMTPVLAGVLGGGR